MNSTEKHYKPLKRRYSIVFVWTWKENLKNCTTCLPPISHNWDQEQCDAVGWGSLFPSTKHKIQSYFYIIVCMIFGPHAMCMMNDIPVSNAINLSHYIIKRSHTDLNSFDRSHINALWISQFIKIILCMWQMCDKLEHNKPHC